MTDRKTDKPFGITGPLQAGLASAAGLVTGMASAVNATHTEFRKKLVEFWRHDREYLIDRIPFSPAPRAYKPAATIADTDPKKLTIAELKPPPEGRVKLADGTPRLAKQYEAHGKMLEKLTSARSNGEITTLEYLERSHQQKTTFNQNLKEFSETRLGIKSHGMEGLLEGTWQRFKFMGKDTRRSIAFNAGIAATVGVAGTMMFFNSINTHNKLSKILENQSADKER